MQQYFTKFTETFSFHSCRPIFRCISGMPNGDKTLRKKDGNGNNKISPRESETENKKQCDTHNYSSFLPGFKGDIKVCIVGGGTAPMYTSILLKQSRLIKRVNLVDPNDSMGAFVLDASYIDTSTRLKHYKLKNIKEALKDVNIIALMDEKDVDASNADPVCRFNDASNYVRQMAEQMVQCRPDSLVAVFVRPITAMLPMVSEIYKCAGWWDPDRIIGSIAIDSMRIEAITAQFLDLNPAFLSVPVVGGADPEIVIPLFSCTRPINLFTDAQKCTLLQLLREVNKEMRSIEHGGPTLSAGAAAAKLILKLAGGLCGLENVGGCAFVRSNVLPVCRFFANELQFGAGGVQRNLGLPKVSSFEVSLIEQAIPVINAYVELGTDAVRNDRKKNMKIM